MMQYLVRIRDKNQHDFLKEYGFIVHVAKLTGMVVLETGRNVEAQLKDHPQVISVRLSDTFQIAR
ncbi:hypothetical protein JIMMER1_43 [Brevibacillus phage Jimmer1]|uniref:Uncharacterized protein n=4 Tax=Jimmervirus TaxID=1984788 RepID=S5M9G5_9CAUD|nr:hypothetical protein AVV10_gp045 [Brevibacillus phage Osiris]YP_009226353.1 hypothetical protein AXJ21_gp043 [Brevibacillus phage Jimmer1]YP_009606470.1 hypothetical protein FDI01_gp043 [Brevibacillus phage Jimmer2]ALA48055.1 hypothetical protein POWDER_45 [Brevibacillus phage Powder]AGR47183.1 hypothetical protein JIMMER2_43 [Brevibacillus phage Jimmer2]AGR47285.1 hypothetical protein JIMMER1_43 [Brevibacillus phage Jimmer1]ALA07314.1 hypothetical protein OSIRIS_45 [Brevibacillus phage Os